jgi:hypothetical protein
MRLIEDQVPANWQTRRTDRHVGHAHFWERALSRRQFLGTAAIVGGGAATAGLWSPLLAEAATDTSTPKPIPGGTLLPFQPTPFHFYFPTANPFSASTIENGQGDPSTIFDFKGSVAVADLTGTGRGKSGTDESVPMFWAADVRVMKGTFVSTAGTTNRGAFAFI